MLMNGRKPDLNLLIVLDALLAERNVTRAAARLGMSQPAVSAALGRLRQLFQDPLFIRAPKGVIPTERAIALAEPLKGVLTTMERLVRPPIFDPRQADRTFRIAANDYVLETLVAPLFRALRQDFRGISLSIRSLEADNLPAKLANCELDLAITTPALADPLLRSRSLYQEHYVASVWSGHPLAQLQAPIGVASMVDFPHTLVSPSGGAVPSPVDIALRAAGLSRRIAISMQSFLALPAMLLHTDVVAIAPARLLTRATPGIFQFDLPLTLPPFDVIAAWHARSQDDAGHRWLRNMFAIIGRSEPEKAAGNSWTAPGGSGGALDAGLSVMPGP